MIVGGILSFLLFKTSNVTFRFLLFAGCVRGPLGWGGAFELLTTEVTHESGFISVPGRRRKAFHSKLFPQDV